MTTKHTTGTYQEILSFRESTISRARGNGVAWHLGAARRFARECASLQANHSDPASTDALTHYCLGAVVLSVGAMEAYGNELLYAKEPNKKAAEDAVRVARGKKKRISGVLAKLVYAIDQRGRPSLDKRAKEYGAARALIQVRNGLVHFWPEWKDEKVVHARIAKQLRAQKVASHPAFDPKAAHFPEEYMAAGLATWACSTAKAFLEWARDAAGETDKKFE
jgi:hypothetical protein